MGNKKKTRDGLPKKSRCVACGTYYVVKESKRRENRDAYCPECREREHAKDLKAFANMTQAQAENIMQAVLHQAAEDYKYELRKLEKATTKQVKEYHLDRIKWWDYWWRNIQPQVSCGMVDGDWAIGVLRKNYKIKNSWFVDRDILKARGAKNIERT